MRGGACKAALALALAGVLTACADGYPSEDGALILGYDMKLEKDTTTGIHTVRVAPAGDGVGVVVLEGVDEHDATQMKWLLDFLPRHCDA